jgi:hypothetical protein
MHLALAEYFRKQRDPLVTFRTEWNGCWKFELRYSQRESWEKLSEIGEGLLTKFLAEGQGRGSAKADGSRFVSRW